MIFLIVILITQSVKITYSSNCAPTEIQSRIRYFDGSELRILSDNLVSLNVDTENVRFLMLGDWGGRSSYPYRTILQRNISEQMALAASRIKSQFIVTLGNNFFDSGVRNINDIRFQRTFENIYESEYLQTPWFQTLGNFDYQGNISAQLDYTNKSKRWIQPSNHYSIDIRSNRSSKILVKIIMIDTVALCNELDRDRKYSNNLETVFQDAKRNPNVTFTIAVGNSPIWSTAYNSNNLNKNCLFEKLRPLLHHYNIKAYFSGNDQFFQHLTDNYLDAKVEYFVAGNGAGYKEETEIKQDLNSLTKLKFRNFNAGFLRLQANITQMSVGFIDSKGKNIYNFLVNLNNTIKQI